MPRRARDTQRKRSRDERIAIADAAERERIRGMTPGERLAEAMALSRTATRLASAPKRRV